MPLVVVIEFIVNDPNRTYKSVLSKRTWKSKVRHTIFSERKAGQDVHS
jgi:hypothetical protein